MKVSWKHLSIVGIAGAIEAITGLALILFPQVLIRLLFGTDIAGITNVIGQLAGIALLALGLGSWMAGREADGRCWALFAILIYNLLVTIYLTFVGLGAEFVGALLWPAAAVHAVLTSLLGHAWFKGRKVYEG